MALALAQYAGILIAKYASGNAVDDASGSNVFGAIDVGAIGGIGCC